MTAYARLLDKDISHKNIILYVVSAGVTLCLTICLKLKDNNIPLPVTIVTLSPLTDFMDSGESSIRKTKKDPLLSVEGMDI